MVHRIKITERSKVEGECVEVHAVSYEGSAPFAGIFQVLDIDTCIVTKPDGHTYVQVICSIGDDALEDETLELRLLEDAHSVIGITGDSEAIRRITWDADS